jgi:hypothetical protein
MVAFLVFVGEAVLEQLALGVDDPAELPGVLQEASREGLQDLGREKFDELRPMAGTASEKPQLRMTTDAVLSG